MPSPWKVSRGKTRGTLWLRDYTQDSSNRVCHSSKIQQNTKTTSLNLRVLCLKHTGLNISTFFTNMIQRKYLCINIQHPGEKGQQGPQTAGAGPAGTPALAEALGKDQQVPLGLLSLMRQIPTKWQGHGDATRTLGLGQQFSSDHKGSHCADFGVQLLTFVGSA